jgi:hypothetical protein
MEQSLNQVEELIRKIEMDLDSRDQRLESVGEQIRNLSAPDTSVHQDQGAWWKETSVCMQDLACVHLGHMRLVLVHVGAHLLQQRNAL